MIDMPLDSTDAVVRSGPAERADTTGLPNLFAQSPRYRWRFIACGVTVTYRTDAAGLHLSGRVVQRRTVASIITLVQLVDESGRVVASVRAAHTMALDRHGRRAADDSWELTPGEVDARQLATRLWNHLAGEARMPSQTGGCWCAPAAGVGRHVNEDGSRC